jgi:hypothetical protein
LRDPSQYASDPLSAWQTNNMFTHDIAAPRIAENRYRPRLRKM